MAGLYNRSPHFHLCHCQTHWLLYVHTSLLPTGVRSRSQYPKKKRCWLCSSLRTLMSGGTDPCWVISSGPLFTNISGKASYRQISLKAAILVERIPYRSGCLQMTLRKQAMCNPKYHREYSICMNWEGIHIKVNRNKISVTLYIWCYMFYYKTY